MCCGCTPLPERRCALAGLFIGLILALVFAVALGGLGNMILSYLASGPSLSPYPSANFPFPACNATGTATGAEVESCTLVSMAVLILAFGLAAGCFTVAWSAALLDFFLRYCNACLLYTSPSPRD